jgi:hypothetical protein
MGVRVMAREAPDNPDNTGSYGTMTAAAVHDAFQHELWRAFRDDPLDGLLDFSIL